MKQKLMYLSIICLTLVMITLMMIPDKDLTKIISNDKIYSIYHSDDNETFSFSILTNNKNSYYFKESYIETSSINNESKELAIEILDIQQGNDEYIYDDITYYQIEINAKIPFKSSNSQIMLTDAFMTINYSNGENVTFSIGEFNYMFSEEINNDISLNNLSATYEEINGINTIGGININLGNIADNNILVTDIKLLSNSVFFNKAKTIEREECSYKSSVSMCLGEELYDFGYIDNQNLDILLGKNNQIQLYCPLIYTLNSRFIHQFSIIIEYQINNESKTFVIDDFPFMKTTIFNQEYEEFYNEYTISSSN